MARGSGRVRAWTAGGRVRTEGGEGRVEEAVTLADGRMGEWVGMRGVAQRQVGGWVGILKPVWMDV